MIIVGVDPGLAATGYAFIEKSEKFWHLIDAGVVHTTSRQIFPERLGKIYQVVADLIQQYQPEALSVERLFHAYNAKSAIDTGHARGVILLAAVHYHVPVFEYAATEVKQSVVGNGAASKQQVQFMVQKLLNLDSPPKPYDKADAIAISLCHAFRRKNNLKGTN